MWGLFRCETMNYNFLATKSDKLTVLNYLFDHTDLQVLDSYSKYGQEICQYKSTAEIAAKFDLETGGQFAVAFQLWSPRFGGEVLFKRIELKPRYCNGHTFRYSAEGWGLIQLYLGGCQNNILSYSHIGHFNEKGALGWEDVSQEKGKVNRWNWKEIAATSRSMKYQIHKMAIDKIGSMSVLPGADNLIKSGVAFNR